jgi:hypothetical protein
MAHGERWVTDMVALRARLAQGGYTRLFKGLEPWSPEGIRAEDVPAFLLDFADRRMVEPPGAPEPEPGIPAGYTYFGQFVNHDITFDPTPLPDRPDAEQERTNFRRPWLDLDSVYGRGPKDQPYLYDRDAPDTLLVGAAADSRLRDLPRNAQGCALIGDARNGENAIVGQLHLAFLLAHNTLVARARAAGAADPFAAARRTLRYLYQHIVWHDFLKRVTTPAVHARALGRASASARGGWRHGMEDLFGGGREPAVPVEFSMAAFRFGHSMVRDAYRTNASRHPSDGAPVPIFAAAAGAADLRGLRQLPTSNGLQWSWFLPMEESDAQSGFPQRARPIDTRLAAALTRLRADETGRGANVLAYRNLVRGWAYGLPAGTEIARTPAIARLGIEPVPLRHGIDIDALWYYLLREAEDKNGGTALGPLGSVIVCGWFVLLLLADPGSYLSREPQWTPDGDPLLRAWSPAADPLRPPRPDNRDGETVGAARTWTLASIIRLAGLPADGAAFERQADRGEFPDPQGD